MLLPFELIHAPSGGHEFDEAMADIIIIRHLAPHATLS